MSQGVRARRRRRDRAVLALLGLGFLAGVVAGLSPCILPVLPVILAATASTEETRGRRPVLVIGGLVLSFSVVTLLGSAALSAVGLPQGTLLVTGVTVLGLVGLSLLVPPLGHLMERPFQRLSQRAVPRGKSGRGFVLGLSLGLVFVPCAGPVLAAITTLGAAGRLGSGTVALTAGYAVGVGLPLLGLAAAGDRLSSRVRVLRTNSTKIRAASGVIMIASAVAIGLGVLAPLQRAVPGYTSALQSKVENNSALRQALGKARGGGSAPQVSLQQCLDRVASTEGLAAEGCTAPEFTKIAGWFNTPGGQPLTLAGLRGHVVLVDFWTYSCINCQRTLPYLRSLDQAFRDAGLTVVGVHTPEFAFEHDTSNVRSAAADLGVRWPVAIDNDYGTWNAYTNVYWPAEYLIDQTGVIRHVHYGEGGYDETRTLIATLLKQAVPTPATSSDQRAATQEHQTPETYLGYQLGARIVNGPVQRDGSVPYPAPGQLGPDQLALVGDWTVHAEDAAAGRDAALLLRFSASRVFLVLSGSGTVTPAINGVRQPSITVSGTPRLYTLVSGTYQANSLLDLQVSPGLGAYDVTFG